MYVEIKPRGERFQGNLYRELGKEIIEICRTSHHVRLGPFPVFPNNALERHINEPSA